MIRLIDRALNGITMYRLVLYYLIFLLATALLLSFVGVMAYDPFAMLLSISILLAACAATNWAFAKAYGVPANVESAYISALILALIITPLQSFGDLWFLGWAAVLAMASKYIVASRGKHLFNPVAFGVAVTYFTLNQSASWWIGDARMLPFVVAGGLLVVRKIGRFDLLVSFLAAAFAAVLLTALVGAAELTTTLQNLILSSPLLFFGFVILTEPLSTPPVRRQRIYYGLLVGLLFAPQLHLGSLFVTPEVAILIGNVFSYAVSPKGKLVLRLKERTRIAPDTYEFIFAAPRRFAFIPGQYMEWTLGHPNPDSRGNRRYFTLASAPTEHNLRLGIKFFAGPSTFKRAMLAMGRDSEIVAGQTSGDFALPADPRQKVVFLAGGIGITPFRSMLKYLLDIRQRRSIVVFYAVSRADEIVYKDVLDRAQEELGIRTIYTVTDARNAPEGWKGRIGRITPDLIRAAVPDFEKCMFYISGSRGMVDASQDILRRLKVGQAQIKTDYFAGLA